jgi:hypothetical protein
MKLSDIKDWRFTTLLAVVGSSLLFLSLFEIKDISESLSRQS